MFAVSAVVLFVIVALGLTAYLGFTARAVIDTEDVSIASAERFGRFELPASTAGLRLRARGSPLEGDLFAKFTIDPGDLQKLLDSTPMRTPLRPDPRLAARAASMADKPWWNPPAPAMTPTRAATPTRETASPMPDATSPTRDVASPTRDAASPTRDTASSTPDVAPPGRLPVPVPLAGLHAERGYTLLLVLDTSDPARVTVYLHATNR